MRILVLGASGQVGHLVVSRALARNHEVVALVRVRSRFKLRAASVRVLEGALKPTHLMTALRGCDAVVVALGHAPAASVAERHPISEGVRNVVAAMIAQKVRRIVVLSADGAGSSRVRMPLFLRIRRRMGPLKEVFDDHDAAEAVLRNTDLDWTLVRAVRFTNGPQSGRLVVSFDGKPRPACLISREVVAQFLVAVIGDETYYREAPTISEA